MINEGTLEDPSAYNRSDTDSAGTSHMRMRGGSSSESEVPFLKPIMGKELASVQFQPLEEQMFRAMAVLHDQKQRHCVARLVGIKAPATLVTPMIDSTLADKKMEKSFLTCKYRKLPFALRSAAAHQVIANPEKKMAANLLTNAAEPMEIKRRIVEDDVEPGLGKRLLG